MAGLKLQTPVESDRSKVGISFKDRIVVLGSCFADNVGSIAADLGFNVRVNPFGTIYNPVSVCNSVARLSSGLPFTKEECVGMGAGSGLFCSFSHHTSFARETPEAFLANANEALSEASAFWREADKVLVTLGTSWCFERAVDGEVVSNCLKIDAKEFRRRRLKTAEISLLLKNLVARHPDKSFIFTVSPIRHFKDGAHGNQLSKSSLLLAVDEVCSAFPDRTDYFPAYEIVLDELRDYRFYSEDMLHPSSQTIDYLWRRFIEFALLSEEIPLLEANAKTLRSSRHRPLAARK